jgi:hypothetical protein
MTCMTISFFGNRGPETDLEDQVADEDTVATLVNLGDELRERLRFISRTTESRLDSGWFGEGGLCELMLYKECSLDEAMSELKALGIDPMGMDSQQEEWSPADRIEP